MAHDDDALGTIICAGVMIFGMAMIAAVLEWQARKDEERRQEDSMILDVLLNEDAGNVLGDSDLAFSFTDPIGPSADDAAVLKSLLAGVDVGAF